MKQKTALSVQSLACHGKCSLTEALPIISAEGISLSVLPTVLLSTHTGGFGIPERLDTQEFFENSLKHFKEEKITFDGIYTGYFSSVSQIITLIGEIEDLKNDSALVLVDPVLGDNGKLFSGITDEFSVQMLKLCQKADIITPNVTEAYLLSGEKHLENPTENDIINLSLKLFSLTKAQVIITGIESENKVATSFFDGEKIKFIYSKKQKEGFHGTGDIFASLIFALLLKGTTLNKAVKKAVCFISKAIDKTVTDERNGLEFESLIKKG